MTLTLNSLNPDCVAVHKSVSPQCNAGTAHCAAVSMVGSHTFISLASFSHLHTAEERVFISVTTEYDIVSI